MYSLSWYIQTRTNTMMDYMHIQNWNILPRRHLKLQTLAVMAGKECKGSPNFSSESGCTWYSRFGVASMSLDLAKAPSWLGAMVRGPRRWKKYCKAISTFPKGLAAHSLSVRVLETRKASRSWRWSCKFSPTPVCVWWCVWFRIEER